MTSRSFYIFTGGSMSMLMILNHTFNMERNKQLYREEIYKLQNIYNFKIEDIGKFRLEDHALR